MKHDHSRQTRALELRLAGNTYRRIGEMIGRSDNSSVAICYETARRLVGKAERRMKTNLFLEEIGLHVKQLSRT